MKMIMEYGEMEIPELKPMDAASFWEFCRLNPDMFLELDKDGNILVMAPVGFDGSKNEARASTALDKWNDAAGLGYVTSSKGGYTLPDGSVRAPDAAWVLKARIDALTRAERAGFPPLCPDFIIEVRSATDSLGPLQRKLEEYMKNGCRLAFLIDPINKQAFVYRPAKDPEHIAGLDATLSGEEVLPGFLLDLKIFL